MAVFELDKVTEFLQSNKANEVQDVRLEDIDQLPEFNPRSGLDSATLKALEEVEDVPAIRLGYHPEYDRLVIIDGNHRYSSRMNRGADVVPAIITGYKTQEEMFVDATVANLNHGLSLNKEDRIYSLSKIVASENEKTGNKIKFKQLAKKLGNIAPRELQKVNCWNVVREQLDEDEKEKLGLNISKADRFYSLIINMKPFNQEKFKEIFNEVINYSFNNIQQQIKNYLKDGKLSSDVEVNSENIQSDIDDIDQFIAEDLNNYEITEEENIVHVDSINATIEEAVFVDDFVAEVYNDLEFKKSVFSTMFSTKDKRNFKNKTKSLEMIKEMRNYLSELENLLDED